MLTYFHRSSGKRVDSNDEQHRRPLFLSSAVAVKYGKNYVRTKNNGGEGEESSILVPLFYISVTRQASSIFIRRFKNVHGTWLDVVFQRTKCILNVYCVHTYGILYGRRG